uniref:Major capsid protein n=1 Tax=Siphoviridae sp. ctZF426 TaxID=2827580 RepID=A0A8S5RSM5_9CAUD|nr:MAG TPA: major capsid protein [Siphoviridae sp. ctZF426]
MSINRLRHLTAFAATDAPADGDNGGGETFDVEIPEDLTALDDAALTGLHARAVEAFRAVYGDGADVTDEALATLSDLADGIEALNAETASRQAAAAERAEKASALAAKVDSEFATAIVTDADPDEDIAIGDTVTISTEPTGAREEPEVEEEEAPAADVEPAPAPAPRQAAGRRTVHLSGIRRRRPNPAPGGGVKRVMFVADVPGFTPGAGADFIDLARAVERRLQGFNAGAYEAAARGGRNLREQHGLAVIRRSFASDVTVSTADPEATDAAIRRAIDESRLPGGSLVASGGWGAPSETVYDVLEMESTDGLVSLPEVNVTRGGIQFTKGPKFSDLYAKVGFSYTEQNDKDGKYAAKSDSDPTLVEGSKPVYKVPNQGFEDVRLNAAGVIVQAGLLQQRGFPELVARTIRGALNVHAHKMSERVIGAMAASSTAVSLPSGQVGAVAPVLTAVDLQAEHYRYVGRLGRGVTLELVVPYWVRGLMRSDLARRLGVDMLDVSDARVDGWFRDRGINVQYVYDWQALSGDGSGFKSWGGEVKFLLYAAGTFVKGTSDILTLDTVYDSSLLGKNDYTALFTEEGWLVAKMGHDSRVVTVPVDPSGHTAGGVAIKADGSKGA